MNNLNKIFQDKQWLNFSNVMTSVRFFLSPIIVVGMYYKLWFFSFFIFAVGAATDLMDGYLARLLHEQTNLGRMLDPIADKFFLIASFFSLSFINSPSMHVPAWFVLFLVTREVLIVSGSMFLLFFCKNFEVKPILCGKLTTVFQVLFIVWIFGCYFFSWIPIRTFNISLVILACYSMMSSLLYAKVGLGYVISGCRRI